MAHRLPYIKITVQDFYVGVVKYQRMYDACVNTAHTLRNIRYITLN